MRHRFQAHLFVGGLIVLLLAGAAVRADGGATYVVQQSTDDTTTSATSTCTTCTNFYTPYTTNERLAFMRFLINVPKGATVTSARLRLMADGQLNNNPTVARVHRLSAINCPTFSTNPYDWAVAEHVDVTVAPWTPGQWATVEGLAPLVQAMIDNPQYNYNYGLGLRVGATGVGGWKRALTWDAGDHSTAPQLEVQWTGGEVPIELWMADPLMRLGQRVYVQLRNTDATDRMIVTLNGTVIHQKPGNLLAEEIVVTDYRQLGAGQHTLRVEVRDEDNELRGAAERVWTSTRSGMPRVGIDENNALCREGVPFFPVTPWGLDPGYVPQWQPYINTLNHPGWNVATNITGWTGYLNMAQSYNLPVIGPLRGNYWPGGYSLPVHDDGDGNTVHETAIDIDRLSNYVIATRDHPALLMWAWKDEPELGGADEHIPAVEVKRWSDRCHELDPHHPHMINFSGYGLINGGYSESRMKEYTFLYGDQWSASMGPFPPFAEKTMLADVVSIDIYVYEYATKYPATVHLEGYALALDRMRQWNHNLVPVMTWVETCDIHAPPTSHPWTPAITPAQLRNLCWVSVIHGAKGVQWFHYFVATPAENYAAMATFLRQITELTPVVLGPEDAGIAVAHQALGGGRVDITARRRGDDLYIFAANMRTTAETVRFSVANMAALTPVAVYDESRTLTAAADGSFEDTFAPLEVHIYRMTIPVAGNVAQWQTLSSHGQAVVASPIAQQGVFSQPGGLRQLAIVLDQPANATTVNPASFALVGQTGGNLSASISAAVTSADGLTITLTFSPALPDADRYTLTIDDSLRSTGGFSYQGGELNFATLAGDITGDGTVTSDDMAAIRTQVGRDLTPANARFDADGSGAITGADMLIVRRYLGNSLP